MRRIFKPGVRLRTRIIIGALVFTPFLLAPVVLVGIGWEMVQMERLRSGGVVVAGVVEGKVIQYSLRADRHVVAYSFVVANGNDQMTPTRVRGRANVWKAFYKAVRSGQKMEVTVIPDDPDINTAGRVDWPRVWLVPVRGDNLYSFLGSLIFIILGFVLLIGRSPKESDEGG